MTKPTTKETLIEETRDKIEQRSVDWYRHGGDGEIKELLENFYDQAHEAGRQERTAEVVELVEGMRKELPILGAQSADDMMEEEVYRGYNQALTDIKNHLES